MTIPTSRRFLARIATRRAARRAALLLPLGAALFAGGQPSAMAAIQYFDFDATTGLTPGTATWDAGITAAWANSATPGTAAPVVFVNGNDAYFQTAGVNLLTLSGAVTANSVQQSVTGTATTVTGAAGSQLTINGGGIVNSVATALTINSDVALGAAQAFNASGTGGITLGGVLSGSAALTITGANNTTFNGNNTATSALTINGILTVNGSNAFSSILIPGGRITANNTAAANNLLGLGTGLVTVNSGSTMGFNANGTANGAQIFTGNGTTLGNDLALTVAGTTLSVNRATGGTFSNSNIVFNNLTLNGSATAVNSGGGNNYGIRFTGTPTLLGTTTFNANGGNQFFDNALTSSGAAGANAFGIIKTGGNALVLGAANPYTGATNVNAGTLALGSGNASGTGAITSATYAGGSILSTSAINLNGTGALQLDNTTGIADRVLDTQAITFNQRGSLILIGNTATTTETVGNLIFNGGDQIVSVLSPGAVTTLAAGSLIRNQNATALVRGTNLNQSQATTVARITLGTAPSGADFVGSNTLTNGTTADATKALRIVPWLVGSASSTGSGTAFVTYDTALGLRPLTTAESDALAAGSTTQAQPVNALASTSTITAGSLTVNSLNFGGSNLALNGTATALTINSGAVLSGGDVNSIGTGFSSLILGNGEGIFNVAFSGNNFTVNTPVAVTGTGNGGITKAGAGNLILGSAANTFTGQTTINQGNLQFAAGINNALNGATGTDVRVNGGALALAATTQAVQNLTFANNGGVTFAAGGILNLNGNVAYDGTGNGAGSAIGANGTVNLNGTRTFTVGDSIFSTAELAVNSVLANGTVAPSGVIKAGDGKLDLNAANTFTGNLTINGGAVLLANAAAPGGGAIQLAGGTLAAPVSLLTNNSNWNNPVNVTGVANFVATADNPDGAHTGALTGNGTLITPASVNLNGGTQNNTSSLKYNGDMSAFSGTFIDNTNTNVIFQGAAANGSALARFQINGAAGGFAAFTPSSNQTAPVTFNLGELSGATTGRILGANANANLVTISVGALNTNSTYNGILSNGGGTGNGPLALTKVGTGALTLTSAHVGTGSVPYTGGTTVNGGTLLVNGGVLNTGTPASSTSGTGSGAVTVGNGTTLNGTLGGSGTINVVANTVTVNAGSTLAPGNSPGILTLVGTQTTSAPAFGTATLNLAPGANLAIELNGTTPGNTATSYDQIVLVGNVSLNGANLTLSLGNGFNPVGTTFTIIDNNTATDLVGGTFASGLVAASNDTGSYNFTVNYTGGDGNNVTLTAAAVPEPGTCALLGLGLVGIGFGLARRRRTALAA